MWYFFGGKSPAQLGLEEVRSYQVHVASQRRLAWATLNHTVCALRFFYGVTLGRTGLPELIPYARNPRKLPVVLSREEVVLLPRSRARAPKAVSS